MNMITVKNINTMTSTQLVDLLHFESKSSLNRAIRSMFDDKIVSAVIASTLRANGQVEEYYLPELESKMFVAKHDITYLEKITKFWIDNTSKVKALPQTYKQALMALVDAEEEKEQLLLVIDNKDKDIEDLLNQFKSGLSIKQFCKQLNGVNLLEVQNTLYNLGWLNHDHYGYYPVSYYADSHIVGKLTTKSNNYNSTTSRVLVLTKKGTESLYRLYKKGGLVMKKGWDKKFSHTHL